MYIPDDIPCSQAFLDQLLSDEPLKTIKTEEPFVEKGARYPFQDDFYRPKDTI